MVEKRFFHIGYVLKGRFSKREAAPFHIEIISKWIRAKVGEARMDQRLSPALL